MPAKPPPQRINTAFVRVGDPIPAGVNVLWAPHPGPQTEALLREEDEILYGGAKGGGKTACGIAWLIKGNPRSDQVKPWDATYINHPHYRALVLRKNLIDLADWIDKARYIYEKLGGRFQERPLMLFEFRSGAKIVLGHLDDSDTYTKYQGQEFQRFLLEEATLVPDLKSYLMVRSCVRSVHPEMVTQTFLTANPGGAGHCLPFGDVLTPNGWADISTMKIGDPVFTVQKDGTLTETVVNQVHSSRYRGDMIRATARGFHLECTPNHHVAKTLGIPNRDRGKVKFSLLPFDELPGQAILLRSVGWVGSDPESIRIGRLTGRRKHHQPLSLSVTDYAELMGWFISEGCLVDRDKAVSLAQMKSYGRLRISKLLVRCGFTFSENRTDFLIYSPEWHAHLRSLGLGKCRTKHIPSGMKCGSQATLRSLFDALVDGDGHWTAARGGSGTYYTMSSRLADDVAEVALKLGYIVYQSSRQRKNRNGLSYEVCFKRMKSGGTELLTGNHVYGVKTVTKRRSDVKRVPFDGMVYCIGVADTHSFIVRQNGCVWISGNSWVRDRFIKPKDAKGNLIPPNTTIVDRDTGETRIFLPAKLADNPSLLNDPAYKRKLMGLPDAERRAFLDGDWDALSGVFFTEFRPNGPLIGEPQEARHVIPARTPAPWLNRMIGMDWGYAHEGAAYWGCDAEDGRFHIYREMVRKNLGAESWGVELALASMDDLRGQESGFMTMYLSPDAWDKRSDTRTIADQIAAGISRVLGPDSVLLTAEEANEPDFFRRLEAQQKHGIVIRKAPNQRIAGAQYIRSQLRWWPLSKMEHEPFDNELFIRLLRADSARAMEYRDAYARRQTAEVLPGLLIHDSCPRLIETLQGVLHDEKSPEDVEKRDGDDPYDAARYLIFAHSKQKAREPFHVHFERRMQMVEAMHGGVLDGNTRVQVARKAEADYAAESSTGAIFDVPRAGGRRAKTFWQN